MAEIILFCLNLCATFLKATQHRYVTGELKTVIMKLMIDSKSILLTGTSKIIRSSHSYTTTLPLRLPSIIWLAIKMMLSLPAICWPNATLHLVFAWNINS